MAADESSSVTDRWFVDSDSPFASDDLTREIRDIDMLEANDLDRSLLGQGLAYRDVSLKGARLLPVDPPETFCDDEPTDSFALEDPFHTSDSSVSLPQNWAGSLHGSLARRIERWIERWERLRLRVHGTLHAVRGELPEDETRAPTVRFAAVVTVAATALVVVVGVLIGAAALGSAVHAETPAPPKVVVAQQTALSQFAVEWATSQNRADMTLTEDEVMDPAAGEPEPETSAAERRRIARAERAERRRERTRRRRSRRR